MENQWDRYGFMETYVENHYLVGGLEHDFIFPYMGNFIIPTGELMFFRGVETTNQLLFFFHLCPCLSTAPGVEVPMVST